VADIHPFVVFLHEQRLERGLSQRALFHRGGPRQRALSQMENGIWTPTLGTVEKYCAGLGDLRLVIIDGDNNIRAIGRTEVVARFSW